MRVHINIYRRQNNINNLKNIRDIPVQYNYWCSRSLRGRTYIIGIYIFYFNVRFNSIRFFFSSTTVNALGKYYLHASRHTVVVGFVFIIIHRSRGSRS